MKPRKAFVVAGSAVLAMSLAASASASAAEPTNWKVKGKPLAPGESRALKLKAVAPVHIVVPEQGLNIECKKSKGAGVITGAKDSASFGTGQLSSLSFTKCSVEGQPGCKIEITMIGVKVETDGELKDPRSWTLKVEPILTLNAKSSPKLACAIAGTHELAGSADSNGPHNQESEFPSTPLSSSTLQFDGHPAAFVGTYKLKAKGGTLEY